MSVESRTNIVSGIVENADLSGRREVKLVTMLLKHHMAFIIKALQKGCLVISEFGFNIPLFLDRIQT